VITLAVGAASACGPFSAGTVQFDLVDGADGTLTGTNPASLQNGQASCTYSVGSQPRQRVRAVLAETGSQAVHAPVYFDVTLLRAADVSYDPSKCKILVEAGVENVQDALDALCNRTGTAEPGVRITGIRLNDAKKTPLFLYENVPANQLENGIFIDCDGPIDARALSSFHNVVVTVDVPYPLRDERDFWEGRELLGTTEVVLYGNTDNVATGIIWVPSERSREWLSRLLMQLLGKEFGLTSVTAHLRVNGNYIWEVPNPDRGPRYLDPELFAVIPARRGQVELTRFGSNVLRSAGSRLTGLDTARLVSAPAVTSELIGRIRATPGSPRFPSGDGQAGGLADLCFRITPPVEPPTDLKLTVGGIAIATELTSATRLESPADAPEFTVADPPKAIQIEFANGAPDPETVKLGSTVLVTDDQGAEVPGRLISVAPNLIGFVPSEGFAGNVRVVLRGGSDGIQALATEATPAHPLAAEQPGGDYEFRFSVGG
jgi:hypothetical protein